MALITYFRSSSYSCWSMCPTQHWLAYTLGFKPTAENGWAIPKPQKKADKGNIVHKALELLARQKLALQIGEGAFKEDETGGEWPAASFTADEAFEVAWGHYARGRAVYWDWPGKDKAFWEFGPKDYRECRRWFFGALELNGGMWNPLNRTVVQPEQYFDLEIEEPWARFCHTLPSGEKVEGRLSIKGTVDLITEEDADTIHYVDWKSGERKNWVTGEPKTWKDLRDDPQLRLYHYALTRLYPERQHVIMTIVYIRDGGAFSLPFGREDVPKTLEMLKRRFETIRDCERPPRIIGNAAENWKCRHLCFAGQNQWPGTGKTVCDHLHGELLSLGMARATEKYAVPGAFASYGEGGGRSAKA